MKTDGALGFRADPAAAMPLIAARHSVRRFTGEPIEQERRQALDQALADLNAESGLHMQAVYDEPVCFASRLAKYGHFENCADYIALVGKKAPDLEERCGYYGELAVLAAQSLGLNTCWVALTHGKSRAGVGRGEKEAILIALGYGRTQGHERPSKPFDGVSDAGLDAPDWYRRGVEAALLAPTAVNQQKFRFDREGDRVTAKPAGLGPCIRIDLGIVKCHFALAAGKEHFVWA